MDSHLRESDLTCGLSVTAPECYCHQFSPYYFHRLVHCDHRVGQHGQENDVCDRQVREADTKVVSTTPGSHVSHRILIAHLVYYLE